MVATESHPLLQFASLSSDKVSVGRLSSTSSSRSSSVAALDPLSIAFDGIDPLSQFAIESERESASAPVVASGMSENDAGVHRNKLKREASGLPSLMESWSSRRAAILNKYTTTERLSIVTSFLTGGETSEFLSALLSSGF